MTYPTQDWYIFNDTMHAFSFKQHVTSPTHKCSHILDLIFSKMNSELNHQTAQCIIHLWPNPSNYWHHTQQGTMGTQLKKKTIRDTTRLTKEILEKYYTKPVIENNASLEQACNQFNEELHKMLNRAAPPKKGKICRQAKNHGTTSTLHEQKRTVKDKDCIYKKHRGDHHWRAYTTKRNGVQQTTEIPQKSK